MLQLRRFDHKEKEHKGVNSQVMPKSKVKRWTFITNPSTLRILEWFLWTRNKAKVFNKFLSTSFKAFCELLRKAQSLVSFFSWNFFFLLL